LLLLLLLLWRLAHHHYHTLSCMKPSQSNSILRVHNPSHTFGVLVLAVDMQA
jgi:hypothetical protein